MPAARRQLLLAPRSGNLPRRRCASASGSTKRFRATAPRSPLAPAYSGTRPRPSADRGFRHGGYASQLATAEFRTGPNQAARLEPALILFTESLGVSFAVRVEEFLAALLPRRFEFGRGDVPVRPALLGNGAQVLAEIFQSGPAEEPISVVDLINDKTGLEDNHVRNHGIVDRVRVFGDVEVLLNDTPRVGEESPVGADSAAIFIRQSDIVGANRDKPAIGNLELTMEFSKPFRLPAVLGLETSAAEDENHRMLSLQFGELPAFCGVVGKLIVGEDNPWNNVRSHIKPQDLDALRRVRSQCRRRICLSHFRSSDPFQGPY